MGYRTWHQANCYITIHVAHIHAQGGRCMTISNIYSIVSISFVHHTNKINFHIIVHHSYIQGRPQGIGGPRRGPRRSEFGGPK